tara:strand:+ start:2007 stop:2996 length:990 start_codon:yes stop_codon:yes gene_type:complete
MPTIIPDSDKIEIKEAFKERYEKLTDFEEFKKYSLSYMKRCIRINTLKISMEDLKKRLTDWKLDQVPWCKEGFNVENIKTGRRDIGNLLEHALGYFYVQENASMIPPVVLEPKKDEIVLDLCAAPGSKTTQIAQYMENTGIILANDYTYMRMKPLSMNLQRCGVLNTITTMLAGQSYKKKSINARTGFGTQKVGFDKVLVDAPCSGTGTIRKSLKTLRIWNPNMVRRLGGTQKQLIDTGFEVLKEGGTMVYSTCSLEPEENEEVVDHLLEKYDNAKLEEIKLNGLNRSESVLEFEGKKYNSEVKKCLRIWPQDNDSEGFFVTKIKKLNM